MEKLAAPTSPYVIVLVQPLITVKAKRDDQQPNDPRIEEVASPHGGRAQKLPNSEPTNVAAITIP